MPIAIGLDLSAFDKAADAIGSIESGPRASRTNPLGDRRNFADPRQLLARRVELLVTKVLNSLRDLTPKKTGRVAASYNVRRDVGATQSKGTLGFQYEIGSDLPDEEQVVVSVLEFGSRPHRIRPKLADWLRFELDPADVAIGVSSASPDDPVVFTKEVFHPGTRPYGMFRITAERAEPEAAKIAAEVAEAVARSAGRIDLRPTGVRLA